MTVSSDEPLAGAPIGQTCTLRSVGWPEVAAGDDLAALVCSLTDLADGDIVVVTSKVVSKAEGRQVRAARDEVVAAESRRVVARRGGGVISETRHGFVMAAAGVDASNTPVGTALTLPHDPDESARRIRSGVLATTGRNVAVVVSDTAGRAWRAGQTDLAVGCAGISPLLDLRGTFDTHGKPLVVSTPALVDEIASAADLVKGKATGRPVAVLSGLGHRVLPPGAHGPGAAALVRGPADDLFGLGAREAVMAAARRDDHVALQHFPTLATGDADPFEQLVEGWLDGLDDGHRRLVLVEAHRDLDDTDGVARWWFDVAVRREAVSRDPALLLAVGRLLERIDTVATAHRLRPGGRSGVPDRRAGDPEWSPVAVACWQDR